MAKKKPAAKKPPAPRYVPGVISDHESYNYAELERRFGIGRDAIRVMRRNGLKSLPLGKSRVIRGAAINEYLAKIEAEMVSG